MVHPSRCLAMGLAPVLVAMLLPACAHGPIGTLPEVSSPSTAAEVIIVRNKSMFGATNSFKITLDGQEILGIRTGEYTQFMVEPGTHSIGVKCFGGWTPTWKEDKKEFSFKAQTRYYFLVGPVDIFEEACAGIEQVAEQEGKERLGGSTYVPAR